MPATPCDGDGCEADSEWAVEQRSPTGDSGVYRGYYCTDCALDAITDGLRGDDA
jgi:hypothetical protein